jgi:5-methylcytosine-specific restriction endonuclease McrA
MAEQVGLAAIRQCSNCLATKPLVDFSKQATCNAGYRHECQACRNAKARQWYLENKDRRQKTVQAWRLANKDKIDKASASWTKANGERKSSHYHARKARLRSNGVYQISAKELKRIYLSSCFYCGAKENITQDHVVPIHRGGQHSIGNLIAACQKCNSSKQHKTITEWKLHLRRTSTKGGN